MGEVSRVKHEALSLPGSTLFFQSRTVDMAVEAISTTTGWMYAMPYPSCTSVWEDTEWMGVYVKQRERGEGKEGGIDKQARVETSGWRKLFPYLAECGTCLPHSSPHPHPINASLYPM